MKWQWSEWLNMLGLTFDVEGIYFCCFRQPTTTSLILSFPLPPFTTIRGFLENALGYERDSFALQREDLFIGIRPLNKIEKNTELAKVLKLKKEYEWWICNKCGTKYLVNVDKGKVIFVEKSGKRNPINKKSKGLVCECNSKSFLKTPYFIKNFNEVSSPMFKTFLVNPEYRIYLVGEDELIKTIAENLKNPLRPLYLGQSDDLVDVKNVRILEVKKTKSSEIYSIIEGVQENCEIVKLPYKFINNGKDVEMKVVSIPKEFPLKMEEEVECFKFGEEYVWCA